MATLQAIIAEEWRGRAAELADWAMLRLVNRRDVWGQYSVLTPTERRNSDRDYKAMTLPAVNQRDENEQRVTLDKLTRHFASRRLHKPQLIGLHAKSQQGTSRWLGIDIDNHADHASSGDELARRNLNAAVGWYRELQKKNFDPLLFDSNGAGGYHLWVLFESPAPTEDVYDFAMAITADWQDRQLERQPETFPKRLKKDSLGSWFRLPGLHHTRDHHSRVWGGDDGMDDPWLTGHAALDAMLACVPGPGPVKSPLTTTPKADRKVGLRQVSQATQQDAEPGITVKAKPQRRFKRAGKISVCVDLDGVLAHRSGNRSLGSPIEGAVEFTRELQTQARIIIYTARFGTAQGKARSAGAVAALEQRIHRWLDKHGFAWDHINTEVAKPVASAYVDDRAVPCRPVSEGLTAFKTALDRIDELKD